MKVVRLYKVLTIVRILRVFKKQKYMELLIQKVNVSPQMSIFVSNMLKILLILHIIGCTWAIVAMLEEMHVRDTWIRARGIEDAGQLE